MTKRLPVPRPKSDSVEGLFNFDLIGVIDKGANIYSKVLEEKLSYDLAKKQLEQISNNQALNTPEYVFSKDTSKDQDFKVSDTVKIVSFSIIGFIGAILLVKVIK